MEHAKVNGVELAYEVVGSGEPMLLIHGASPTRCSRWSQNRRSSASSASATTGGVSVGAPPGRPGPTSVAVQAKDAVGSSTTSEVDRAHVVGHSLGGAIALELAVQHPTRVASLVLLEPAFLTTPAGAAFARAVAPLSRPLPSRRRRGRRARLPGPGR